MAMVERREGERWKGREGESEAEMQMQMQMTARRGGEFKWVVTRCCGRRGRQVALSGVLTGRCRCSRGCSCSCGSGWARMDGEMGADAVPSSAAVLVGCLTPTHRLSTAEKVRAEAVSDASTSHEVSQRPSVSSQPIVACAPRTYGPRCAEILRPPPAPLTHTLVRSSSSLTLTTSHHQHDLPCNSSGDAALAATACSRQRSIAKYCMCG